MSREPRWCLLVRADSVPDWAVPQSFTTPEVKETGQGEVIKGCWRILSDKIRNIDMNYSLSQYIDAAYLNDFK